VNIGHCILTACQKLWDVQLGCNHPSKSEDVKNQPEQRASKNNQLVISSKSGRNLPGNSLNLSMKIVKLWSLLGCIIALLHKTSLANTLQIKQLRASPRKTPRLHPHYDITCEGKKPGPLQFLILMILSVSNLPSSKEAMLFYDRDFHFPLILKVLPSLGHLNVQHEVQMFCLLVANCFCGSNIF
jgi:hypothetical protein